MHGMGVRVAVIQGDQVLLMKREDFEVWSLPGGEIEDGESPAQTALREVLEETGLTIQLTRLVGLYTTPQWTSVNTTNAVFAASVLSGTPHTQAAETLDIGFFAKEQLPQSLMWWVRREVEDALTGIGGSAVWTQDVPWPQHNPTRWELYAQRDASGLSRAEFFDVTFPKGSEHADIEGKACTD